MVRASQKVLVHVHFAKVAELNLARGFRAHFWVDDGLIADATLVLFAFFLAQLHENPVLFIVKILGVPEAYFVPLLQNPSVVIEPQNAHFLLHFKISRIR